jgi:hypothetical protein
MKGKILFVAILLCALAFRVYGINWDSNQHLHPDERFLTMVAAAARIPSSFSDYMDPNVSTLNPYNLGGFNFFVYGTLPLTITKLAASISHMDSYDGVVIMGRFLSALADVGVLVFVYLIASILERKYAFDQRLKYFAAFLYAVAVLPIQQSHFFTTDSFAVFFSMGALWGAIWYWETKKYVSTILCGIFFGLAVASKITSVYILPLIVLVYLCGGLGKAWRLLVHGLVFGLFGYLSLRIGDPRFFASGNLLIPLLNPQLLDNIAELKRLSSPDGNYPPGVQWLHRPSILFPFVNLVVLGLGIPSAALAFLGMGMALQEEMRKKIWLLVAVIAWMIAFFIYQGVQFVMTMRYFYILYPLLALFGGLSVVKLLPHGGSARTKALGPALLLILLIWPACFITTYKNPHPYIQASEWIYQSIPEKSTIVFEHWNDVLPLNLPPDTEGNLRSSQRYTGVEIGVFNPDDPGKFIELDKKLHAADYLVLVNGRSYRAILTAPDRYPLMVQFYHDLFSGRKGYELVATFPSSREFKPGLFADRWLEQVFWEYDNPHVLIYKKMN